MVELKKVSFRYGSEETQTDNGNSLTNINLVVETGEFVLLTGPSGCGKTTVLRLINGLIPHFYSGTVDGEILIDGERVYERELYDTALSVGTVFQNPRTQFYNVDTTGELAFGCENRGLPEKDIFERIDGTVSCFHIENLMDRNIFHLSGGEKQKIACASVSVSDPDIILLDEPSANLDYEGTMALRSLIDIWRKQGKTIIAAEHRIAYLWDLLDRVIILQNGRIVRELSREEKHELRDEDAEAMGLRSIVMEDPKSVSLPNLDPDDKTMVLKDFSFSYRKSKRRIVDYPKLELAEKEITAVTGLNGGGKTTLLHCICGLEKRCEGTLEYQGEEYKRKERQNLCFLVMQDTGNQLFTESVLEEVLISLPKGTEEPDKKAREILRILDLEAYEDRHPQSLSGGQKQRLAIASALASGRKILLLDEPTSGLDRNHMKETAELLSRLKESGITIIVVTHDSELIHACCTRKLNISNR